MKIHFLYGTETGTAEFLCDDLMAAAGDGHACESSCLDDQEPSAMASDVFYVLVTATFGSGDLPGTALAFFETLQKDRPDLGHVRFAIFGLGDQTFGETYNQGSEKLMTEMLACQAKMVGERGLFDAASADMPEDIGVPWLEGILAQAA